MILNEQEIQQVNIDGLALRVFLKALDLIGGPRALFEYRNLTWVPSLIEAAYAVVLANELLKTEDEIAEFIGITRQTVRNMLRADVDLVKQKLRQELADKTIKAHTAGGLAKWAYEEIKRGNEQIPFLAELLEQASEALGVEWPIKVLQRIRGLKFPTNRLMLQERLRGLKIYGVPVEELLEGLEEPVQNPAALLKGLRLQLEARGVLSKPQGRAQGGDQ